MTRSFSQTLGLGPRELVSFVGAGGKSTLLLGLGHELAKNGHRVVLTTTTKMGTNQIPPSSAPVHDLDEVRRVIAAGNMAFLIGETDGPKVIGVPTAMVDELFDDNSVDYIVVEADGARRRAIKAPAEHEPVIPSRSTTVVVVTGLDAVGNRVDEVAHRPELVSAITGRGLDEKLTPEDLAAVIGSQSGGLARVPDETRVVVALTQFRPDSKVAAESIQEALRDHPRIDRICTF
ncbi:MAG: selenium cofactor biosynthesis protein YqeC [Acidimicrobiia bacterium]